MKRRVTIGGGTVGVAGITIVKPEGGRFRGKQRPDPLVQGFRPGHVPLALQRQRYFANASVEASSVVRVDAPWIHGRDRDAGMRLAWSEGLATFMSLALQKQPVPSLVPSPRIC